MADDQDQSQKTEEPTQKRLEDARKKGQLANSREINHLFILSAFAMIIMVLLPGIMKEVRQLLLPFVESPDQYRLDTGSFRQLFAQTISSAGLLMVVPALFALTAALSAGIIQTKLNVSFEPIIPKLEKISPLKGLKRLFSLRSAVEFLKGIFKITLVGFIAATAVWPYLDQVPLLPVKDIPDILAFLFMLIGRVLIGVLVIMVLVALIDYAYQKFEFIKNLRMTKQEVKDEYKQQEGDPMVKQKLRAIRMERAKKRMMANVPESDVVITNPTHYAVALKYDAASMAAPVVMAKGTDKVAARIREVAQKHKILILRNPPLARAIFNNVDIEDPIPLDYYEAVAKIISYVYKLKGKDMPKEATGEVTM